MSKGTQLWPGTRMRAFFRGHIRRETSLDAKASEKLVEALTKATNRMLVWEMPAEPAAAAAAPAGKDKLPAKGTKKDEAPFDPYAFSAMVVLSKQGKDGLLKRLSEIRSVENLKKLAEAQHLGIDKQLSKIDEVRKAIVGAAEQRLADRRAAAS